MGGRETLRLQAVLFVALGCLRPTDRHLGEEYPNLEGGSWVADLGVAYEEFEVVERSAQTGRLRLQIRRRSHQACRLVPQLEVSEG